MRTGNFSINEWFVKPSTNVLIKDGKEVHIEPKIMSLLVYLAKKDGELASRQELLENVWSQVVVPDVLNNTIANLRRVLGDTQAPRQYISTITRQGYLLVPTVSWESEEFDEIESNEPVKKHEEFDQQTTTVDTDIKRAKKNYKPLFLLIIALIAILIIYFQSNENVLIDDNSIPTINHKTIAVLPFDAFSLDENVQFFADGLVEELIHQLSANKNLRVIARTSSDSFRGSKFDIREISNKLGARYIVEGSIRQNEDYLRVTVQLIDASNGFHIWSKTFDHKNNENLLDIQMTIGEKITSFVDSGSKSPTIYRNRKHPQSAEAYSKFLVAQSHMKFIEVEHLEKAAKYFQQAIDIAPDYAVAYTGIAAAQLLLYQYKHTSLSNANRLASTALAKAFSIEPNLAEAFAVRGLLETYLQKYSKAEDDFKKAIALNPGLRFARHNYGFMLWRLSRSKDAYEQFQMALEMDPLSSITNFGVGDTLGNLGEFDKAITHYLQCQEFLPNDFSCFLGLANIYKLIGDIEQYSHYLRLAENLVSDDNFWIISSKGANSLFTGDLNESEKLLEKAFQIRPQDYHLLKSRFVLSLKTSSLDEYTQELKQLSIENPNNFDINMLLGLVSYFESNCNLSISQYEQGIKEHADSLIEIWDFAQGLSHLLNLAHCYQETSQPLLAQDLLEQFNKYISSLPETTYAVPGKIYSEARYLMLTGKPDEAKVLLQQVRGWPLIWIYDHDPTWLK